MTTDNIGAIHEPLVVRWHAEDVLELKPEWTLDQCQAFLEKNKRALTDSFVETGWQVLQAVVDCEE